MFVVSALAAIRATISPRYNCNSCLYYFLNFLFLYYVYFVWNFLITVFLITQRFLTLSTFFYAFKQAVCLTVSLPSALLYIILFAAAAFGIYNHSYVYSFDSFIL